MGNGQSAGKDSFSVGWLTGIIDGEGWLILNRQLLSSKNYRYVPVIGMNTTSDKIADEFHRLLRVLNVGVWRGLRHFKNPKHKKQHQFNVRGFKRCLLLIELIDGRLIEKQTQLDLLKEYIMFRLSLPLKSPCGTLEDEYYQKLKGLNE